MAKDSEKLGGQLPSYYAKKSELDSTKDLLDYTINRVTKNESDIVELQNKTDETNTHLQQVDEREAEHYEEFKITQNQVNTNSILIGELDDSLENLKIQMGWEILFA